MSVDPAGAARDTALELAHRGQFASAVDALVHAFKQFSGSDERTHLAAAAAETARLAEAAGDLDAAQAALEAATARVEWADLLGPLGSLYARRGRTAEARATLDRALAINPRYRTAVIERALLDAREGRIAEAVETLRVLAAEGAIAEPGAYQQGMERLGHAEFDDAAPLLRRALHGGDPWLEERLHRYQELVYGGEGARALAVLREAVHERPGYPDLQLLIGAHELQTGTPDDAVESFVRALELNPGFHAARLELARALESLGERRGAVEQLELLLATDASHAQARALLERWTASRRGSREAAAA